MRKKLSFMLSALLLCLLSAYAQATLPDLESLSQISEKLNQQQTVLEMQQTQQEIASELQECISIADSISMSLPEDSSIQQQLSMLNKPIQSMSLPELLTLTKQIYSWQSQVSANYLTLVSEKQNLMKNLSEKSLNCLNLAQKALESNREDTKNAIEELGNIYEQLGVITSQKNEILKEYEKVEACHIKDEKRLNNSYKIGSIAITLVPLSLLAIGAAIYKEQPQIGKDFLISGSTSLFSAVLIYQGGHWIFKVW